MGLALREAVARRWRFRSGCCASAASASEAAAPDGSNRRFRPRRSPAPAARHAGREKAPLQKCPRAKP